MPNIMHNTITSHSVVRMWGGKHKPDYTTNIIDKNHTTTVVDAKWTKNYF